MPASAVLCHSSAPNACRNDTIASNTTMFGNVAIHTVGHVLAFPGSLARRDRRPPLALIMIAPLLRIHRVIFTVRRPPFKLSSSTVSHALLLRFDGQFAPDPLYRSGGVSWSSGEEDYPSLHLPEAVNYSGDPFVLMIKAYYNVCRSAAAEALVLFQECDFPYVDIDIYVNLGDSSLTFYCSFTRSRTCITSLEIETLEMSQLIQVIRAV